ELGWGGYWAWDPVENASLFPWLTATAFLHSMSIYEKKNTLKIWSYFLIFTTFILCIFGTFLTRSGILSSVHAFPENPIGKYFLIFMALLVIYLIVLIANRYSKLSGNEIETYFSREGSFAITNWLFLAFTFVVFWGTLLPLLTGTTGEDQLTVSKEFFYAFTSPLAFSLIFLMGVCPYLIWGRFNYDKLKRNLKLIFFITVLVVLPSSLFWAKNIFGFFGFIIGSFTFVSLIYLLYKDSSAHSSASGKSFLSSLLSIFKKDRRKYGGLIAHLGVTLMFIGIVGSTLYPQDIQQELLPNEYIQISDVTLKYIDIETRKGINFETIGVRMSLYEKNKFKGMITPSMAFYKNPETQTAEVAIKWGIFRDIYVA
ncbi:MAG: cytochrome c biogenesis protein CcsA, partial [Actinomycetia bacterium]|nr:cytochrome c biogenesis protein CcsA [Actinomycetes bacterium]